MNVVRILEALASFPEGLTLREIMTICPLLKDQQTMDILTELVKDGSVVACSSCAPDGFTPAWKLVNKSLARNGKKLEELSVLKELYDEFYCRAIEAEEKLMGISDLLNNGQQE